MKPILCLVACMLAVVAMLAVPVSACPVGQLNAVCSQNYVTQAVVAQPVIAYNVVPQLVVAQNVGYGYGGGQAIIQQANYGGNVALVQTGCAANVRVGAVRAGRGRVVQRSVVRGPGVRRGGAAVVVGAGY